MSQKMTLDDLRKAFEDARDRAADAFPIQDHFTAELRTWTPQEGLGYLGAWFVEQLAFRRHGPMIVALKKMLFAANLYDVGEKFDMDAATLFKLSEGAQDPRENNTDT